MEDLGVQNHLWLHSQFEVGLHQTLSRKKKGGGDYMDLGDVSPGKRSIMQAPQLEFNSQNPTKKKKKESGGVHL